MPEPPGARPPGQEPAGGKPPPRAQATALVYTPGERAPRVVATGVGLVADRIVAAAQESGVPVRSDPALAQALATLDLGEEVPEVLYAAVAVTLAWAYRLDAKAAARRRESSA